MLRRSRKKIKDLVDMLENPEGAAYVAGILRIMKSRPYYI